MNRKVGVVLAGGVGNRYGANVPKQYLHISNKEVISFSIDALKGSNCVDNIIVVCDSVYQDRIASQYGVEVCNGGDTRNKSVKSVLNYINDKYSDCEKIIILESARPLCSSKNIDDIFELLDDYDSVITGQKIVDSLGSYKQHIVNREEYYMIQAPEAFDFKLLFANFDENSSISATCQQLPEESSLYVYYGIKNNLKITYNGDIEYIETLLRKGGIK